MRQGVKYFKYYKYFYNSLEKGEKRLKSFSSHALYVSHNKIKCLILQTSDTRLHHQIIYVLFSIKVFLLVTKHKPEAIEQQRELQNDGSLTLVLALSSFKKRKTR